MVVLGGGCTAGSQKKKKILICNKVNFVFHIVTSIITGEFS